MRRKQAAFRRYSTIVAAYVGLRLAAGGFHVTDGYLPWHIDWIQTPPFFEAKPRS